MEEVNFETGNGIKIKIKCNLKDKMLKICQKAAIQLKKDINSIIFLFNGNKIDLTLNLTLEKILKKQKRDKIVILVYDIINNKNNTKEDLSKKKKNGKVINMWINENYCSNWGFKEAIREFLQNQHDGMIDIVENEDEIIPNGKGHKYINKNNSKDIEKFLNYEFRQKSNDEFLGEIIYDESKKQLSIINKGEINLEHFVLGSLKEKKGNKNIIGKFGEGMELAILALMRLKKEVEIRCSNKSFYFDLKKGELFSESKNEIKTLHCIYLANDKNDLKNKVNVLIGNISKDEWNDEILKYLWLLNKNQYEIYVTRDKDWNCFGEILASPLFENKLYVNGIYVKDIEAEKIKGSLKGKEIPGFNIDIEIDRDRNCVINTYDMFDKFGKILSNALKTNKKYYNNIPDKNAKKEVKKEEKKEEKKEVKIKEEKKNEKPKEIIDYGNPYLSNKAVSLLNDKNINFAQDIWFTSSFVNEIKDEKKIADSLWRTWEKMNNIEHMTPPLKQPASNSKILEINEMIEENKLNKDFYSYLEVTGSLMEVLKQSNFYLDPGERFKKTINKSEIVIENEEVKKFLEVLEKIIPRIQKGKYYFPKI